jgi:type II pantothenate kinase
MKIEDDKIFRVGGSALGGGTIIGLSKLLLKTENYEKISKYAEKGDRTNIDILVKDIYPLGIEHIDGSLTASNFGKAAKKKKEDMARAIFQMIGENIAIMSALYAKNHELSEIFYIGTPVKDNDLLRSVLQTTTKMMKMHSYFIPSGEYAGAIGAYLYGKNHNS